MADSAGRVWTVELAQDVSRPRTPAGEADAEQTSVTGPLKVAIEDGRAATQMCWAGAAGALVRSVCGERRSGQLIWVVTRAAEARLYETRVGE